MILENWYCESAACESQIIEQLNIMLKREKSIAGRESGEEQKRRKLQKRFFSDTILNMFKETTCLDTNNSIHKSPDESYS